MISRRNIRVKVMQTLYTLETTGDAVPEKYQQTVKMLDKKLQKGGDMFIISLAYLYQIAAYASSYAAHRASKYLPTQEDLNVSTKIADNTVLQQLIANTSFKEKITDTEIEQAINKDWTKKLFLLLQNTPEYKQYVAEENNPKADKKILQFIWEEIMLGNEGFTEFLEEEFQNWNDDGEMTVMLMDNFFQKPGKIFFDKIVSDEKMTYSHDLLKTVIEKKTYCAELITPKLKNWDAERVALVDLLLLRMGVCEFLYFPTI